MCSETSPRISFSHDLCIAEEVLAIDQNESRRDTMLLDSNPDFEFSVASSFEQESLSADELFANGVILPAPVQIQDRIVASKQVQKSSAPPTVSLPPLPPPSTIIDNSKKEISVKEILVVNYDSVDQKPQAKSFWGFKRSSSLNHEAKKSLICSLPLLSRSNSTGSVSNKRSTFKDAHKSKSSSSSSSSSSSNAYLLQQKPPLKKSYVGAYGNGVKISPVLNVPPPYISKGTANLFGLGSFLRSGSKDKKKNKK